MLEGEERDRCTRTHTLLQTPAYQQPMASALSTLSTQQQHSQQAHSLNSPAAALADVSMSARDLYHQCIGNWRTLCWRAGILACSVLCALCSHTGVLCALGGGLSACMLSSKASAGDAIIRVISLSLSLHACHPVMLQACPLSLATHMTG